MEVSLGQGEHIARLLNGFESLFNEVEQQDADRKYLNTCLSLNGVESIVDGQEGFVDAIKNAGAKFYQMIKNFLKMIRDFFTGSKGRAADQAVTQAVAVTKTIAKEAPKSYAAAEPEEKEKMEKSAVRLSEITFAPLPASLRVMDKRFTENKNGHMSDINATSELAGKVMEDFSKEINNINAAYMNLSNFLSRGKDGNMNGYVSNVEAGANVVQLLQFLRANYKALQAKLIKPTEDFNELFNTAKTEKQRRAAQKVTRFLASFNNDIARSIDATTRLISRIENAMFQVGVEMREITPEVVPNTLRISGPVDLDNFMGYDAEL